MQHLGIPFLLKMQHEVLFFSPHFIDDTLNTRAECVRDSLICRKYMFLAKIFALRSMGIQLVPSPLIDDACKMAIIWHIFKYCFDSMSSVNLCKSVVQCLVWWRKIIHIYGPVICNNAHPVHLPPIPSPTFGVMGHGYKWLVHRDVPVHHI